MRSLSLHRAFLLVSLLAWSVSPAPAADRYTLDVPGDANARSVAVIDGNSLTITDSAGRSFAYVRTPQFDSADGQLAGFYSKAANQTLQWPVAGTGRFLIGDPQGRQFRESRMQITRVPAPREALRPAVPPNQPLPVPPVPNVGRGPALPQQPLPPQRPGRDVTYDLAVLAGADRSVTAASIDSRGRLQVFRGRHDTWRRQPAGIPAGLVPGAPLALADAPRGTLPFVYTVSDRGELLELADGRPRVITNAAFVPGTHLTVGMPRYPSLFAVDEQGRLLQMGLADGKTGAIDANAGRYGAGIPIAIASAAGADEIFLIDRGGTLVSYRTTPEGRWDGPEAISRGFLPGGHLTAALLPDANGDSTLALAAVDARGSLQAYTLDANGWNTLQVGQVPLPPGAPIALAQAADGLHLSSVTRDGTWVDWFQSRRGLVPTEIGRGFPPGAPVELLPHRDHLHGFCADAAGRLVAASQEDGRWMASLFSPDFDVAPRLIGRRVVPNAALPVVTVRFDNRHNEQLLVTVTDELGTAGPTEMQIIPGGSADARLARDAGGVLEETWLVTLPNGQTVEKVQQTPIPPQPRYRVTVAANRTTYQYIDKRKRPGPLKDFDLQTPVSLGTFRVPPGADLRDGDAFDVYREATARGNPGAAAFDLKRP